MKCRELYRVTIEYDNVTAEKKWQKRFDNWSRAQTSLDADYDIPKPPRIKVTRHAAVYPTHGGDSAKWAADAVCEMVVGPPNHWETWGVMVLSVERVDTVAVPETS